MPMEATCDCALCDIEVRLLSELCRMEDDVFAELYPASTGLRPHSSVSSLLSHLRTSPADARSDDLLRELFALRRTNVACVDSLIILAFLPMLHRTVRRVAKQQLALPSEDITQQALSFLLEFLRSEDMRTRKSHFAFAISRAVKRQMFEWANRESAKASLNHYDAQAFAALADEDPFERHALLRHFLHRCVTKGLLTDEELDLLVEFKLNGTNGEEFADFHATSSNAVRQRLKRLLAKLRRLAG